MACFVWGIFWAGADRYGAFWGQLAGHAVAFLLLTLSENFILSAARSLFRSDPRRLRRAVLVNSLAAGLNPGVGRNATWCCKHATRNAKRPLPFGRAGPYFLQHLREDLHRLCPATADLTVEEKERDSTDAELGGQGLALVYVGRQPIRL